MLEIRGLDVAYGESQVLWDVSLDVPTGTMVCLMERNGVGKTTLLKSIMGLLPMRAGRVAFDGTDLGGRRPEERVAFGIGYVPGRLDTRVRAVVAYAADLQYYGPYQPNQRPLLHFLSDQDPYNPYGDAIAWDRGVLQQPRTVVTLWNASHEPPFLQPADPHFEMVARVTIGSGGARASLALVRRIAKELREGSCASRTAEQIPYAELNRMLR